MTTLPQKKQNTPDHLNEKSQKIINKEPAMSATACPDEIHHKSPNEIHTKTSETRRRHWN